MGLVAVAGAAGMALSVSGCGVGKVHHENRAYDVAGITPQTGKVRIDSDSGDIQVVGADTDRVSVQERLSYTKKNKPRTEHSTVNGEIVLRYKCPNKFTIGFSECGVTYRVQVPRRMAVGMDTGSGGLRVSGVQGAVRASTDSGSIDARDLRSNLHANTGSGGVRINNVGGAVEASTDSGSIDANGLSGPNVTAKTGSGGVRLRFAAAPTKVDAKTDSGSVRLWLPADQKYKVTAKTDAGEVDNQLGNLDTSTRLIEARTGSGGITIAPA